MTEDGYCEIVEIALGHDNRVIGLGSIKFSELQYDVSGVPAAEDCEGAVMNEPARDEYCEVVEFMLGLDIISDD
ncbi:7036_t:CDS:2 [Ambispora leptoticha]|uniref:7036_t:CDS:1 n=1 Tax=Ambispora leptoticha TaxID=144679 RepID=A0A9N9HAL0_9GLOM|nr:7036_t:CDS:2 [Ambispora leptoticha]